MDRAMNFCHIIMCVHWREFIVWWLRNIWVLWGLQKCWLRWICANIRQQKTTLVVPKELRDGMIYLGMNALPPTNKLELNHYIPSTYFRGQRPPSKMTV